MPHVHTIVTFGGSRTRRDDGSVYKRELGRRREEYCGAKLNCSNTRISPQSSPRHSNSPLAGFTPLSPATLASNARRVQSNTEGPRKIRLCIRGAAVILYTEFRSSPATRSWIILMKAFWRGQGLTTLVCNIADGYCP